MCGIIGSYDPKGTVEVPEVGIRAGMDLMAARGPDGSGVHLAPGLAFGHRRLAVISPDDGQQPFVDSDTGKVVVFNGEIFNYPVLRKHLAGRGRVFRTTSDVEVLLRAWEEWGEGCLERLVGMFAFAAYDPATRRILVARDRLGVKPLFYSTFGGRLMFASTCAALRCFEGVGDVIDPAAVSHYLTTIRTSFGSRTLFKDIQTLLPGEFIVASPESPAGTVRRYWDIEAIPPRDKTSPGVDEAAGEARALLEEAVSGQLISDVPLGGFLSGGLDSSIIASLAGELTCGNYHAYSVGYERDAYNEWDFVRTAASHFGMQCREIMLNEQDFPGTWTRLIRSKGLPVSTPNEIGIYHLAASLRQDYTVALSGEGADEIFGGYTVPYFSAYDYDRARRQPLGKDEPPDETDTAMRRLYGRSHLICRPDHYLLVNSWIPFNIKRRLLGDQTWQRLSGDEEIFSYYEDWFDRLAACSTFDSYMHVHARVNLEGLLSRVDSSTMAASVEARVPFTDHRIVEYAFSLPDSYKMNWCNEDAQRSSKRLNVAEIDRDGLVESKVLLRRAFAKEVPRSILERRKVSFPVPFREEMPAWLTQLPEEISSSPFLDGFFDKRRVDQLFRNANNQSDAMYLWPIVNLCLWQRECSVAA